MKCYFLLIFPSKGKDILRFAMIEIQKRKEVTIAYNSRVQIENCFDAKG